ncbi:MAG: erv26 super protein [Chaenotheca gracillima]|nr:MAG: erv26 super protein [Chaenotheca gracillima]
MQILPSVSIGNVFNKKPFSRSPKTSVNEKLEALDDDSTNEILPTYNKRSSKKRTFFMALGVFSLITALALASVALAMDVTNNPDLVAKLKMAATNMDRMKLLPKDSDWQFDFTKQEKYTFSPGGVINANAATFPATVGNGLTMAMLNLGACSMLPPHYHPRASNYVVAVYGTTDTYMISENGARTVHSTLKAGQMTIFPQASVHTMVNNECENAQLVSALAADDAGTNNIANALFSLPPGIVNTVLGSGVNINATEMVIPPVGTGSNGGSEECLARCKAKGKLVRRTW